MHVSSPAVITPTKSPLPSIAAPPESPVQVVAPAPPARAWRGSTSLICVATAWRPPRGPFATVAPNPTSRTGPSTGAAIAKGAIAASRSSERREIVIDVAGVIAIDPHRSDVRRVAAEVDRTGAGCDAMRGGDDDARRDDDTRTLATADRDRHHCRIARVVGTADDRDQQQQQRKSRANLRRFAIVRGDMKKLRVGVLGATGMVGQRFVSLLADHPWFEVTTVAASPSSAGKTYGDAVTGRWALATPVPAATARLVVGNASDVTAIASQVDFVFCAVDMPKEDTAKLEEDYARAECAVVSANSAHRWTPDVPMMVPELNAHHSAVIEAQRKRLGTKRGFIAAKPNCSLQSYVPAIHPLLAFGPSKIAVSHVPSDQRCRQDVRDVAGDDRQRDPVHQRRRGKVRARAAQDLGRDRKRTRSSRRRRR